MYTDTIIWDIYWDESFVKLRTSYIWSKYEMDWWAEWIISFSIYIHTSVSKMRNVSTVGRGETEVDNHVIWDFLFLLAKVCIHYFSVLRPRSANFLVAGAKQSCRLSVPLSKQIVHTPWPSPWPVAKKASDLSTSTSADNYMLSETFLILLAWVCNILIRNGMKLYLIWAKIFSKNDIIYRKYYYRLGMWDRIK